MMTSSADLPGYLGCSSTGMPRPLSATVSRLPASSVTRVEARPPAEPPAFAVHRRGQPFRLPAVGVLEAEPFDPEGKQFHVREPAVRLGRQAVGEHQLRPIILMAA